MTVVLYGAHRATAGFLSQTRQSLLSTNSRTRSITGAGSLLATNLAKLDALVVLGRAQHSLFL